MVKEKSAKTRRKISRGLKEYWKTKGKKRALQLGAAGVGTLAAIKSRKKLGNIANSKTLGDFVENKIYQALKDPTDKPTPYLVKRALSGAKKGLAKRKLTEVQRTPKATVEAFQEGLKTDTSSKSRLVKAAGALGRLRARAEARARKDRAKLGFTSSFEPYEFNRLKKGLVKVAAHRRDGKWVTGFKRTQKLAKARKAAKLASDPGEALRGEIASTLTSTSNIKAAGQLSKARDNKFLSTGELPSRGEAGQSIAKQTGSYAANLIKNPRTTITRGFERENIMLAELSEFADREITKKELISRAIQPAKDQFNKKLDELKNNPKKFLQSELAETLQLASSDLAQNGYIATGGFVGGAIGSVAGPKGALAGDLLGARVVRRGITDTKAVTQAIRNRQNLPELEPEFGVNPRVQKFGQIMEDAIQRSKQEISEQGRAGVFDDVGGWAAGNAVGVGMLGGSIPGAGMGPGMAGSIYAQSVEKRMRDTGEDLVTAATNLISDKVKQGNAREQALRDKIKEHWTRLLYLEGDM